MMVDRIVVPATAEADGGGLPPKLSRKQQAVVSYLEHHPQLASYATATELAHRVGVHPATVVRLARELGYDGFADLQEAIRHRYLASIDAVALMNVRAADRHGDVVLSSLDQDIRNLSTTRGILDRDEVRRVAALIREARTLLFVGVGSHAGVALIFSHLARFMGLRAEAETHGGVTLATRLAALGPGDVVLATSAWWVLRETRDALVIARERGAATVAIVDNRASPLAQVADHALVTRTESVSFFQSMIGPLAVANALIAEVAATTDGAVRGRMDDVSRIYDRLGLAWHGPPAPFEPVQDGAEDE